MRETPGGPGGVSMPNGNACQDPSEAIEHEDGQYARVRRKVWVEAAEPAPSIIEFGRDGDEVGSQLRAPLSQHAVCYPPASERYDVKCHLAVRVHPPRQLRELPEFGRSLPALDGMHGHLEARLQVRRPASDVYRGGPVHRDDVRPRGLLAVEDSEGGPRIVDSRPPPGR